jgi:hypothetical protein
MMSIKKMLESKLIKALLIVVVIGLIFANIGNVLYYGIIGVVVVVGGIVVYSFYETLQEAKTEKKK